MKKAAAISTIIALLATFLPLAGAQAAASPAVYLNDAPVEFAVDPLVVDRHTLVPMRDLFEALGATVDWDGESNSVEARRGSHVVRLTVGQMEAVKDGSAFDLEVAPLAVKGHVMVPLRFIAEALDDKVEWIGARNAAYIYTDQIASPLQRTDYSSSYLAFPYTAPRTDSGYDVDTRSDMVRALKAGLTNFEETFKLDCSGYKGDAFDDFEPALAQAQAELQEEISFFSIYNEIHWEKFGDVLTVRVDYLITRDQFEETRQEVSRLADTLVQPGMTDIEKERVFHDYLCNNCSYDLSFQDPSYSAYGALILGRAVCQGYSEAMGMLCLRAGIDCRIITGTAQAGSGWAEDHAWNLIEIDGRYRHVDVTYDDPVSYDGQNHLTYEYFNLSDAQISNDHFWDSTAYPAAP